MKFKIFIPAGNPTALVIDENLSKDEMVRVNDYLMSKFEFVEQVGFLDKNSLKMAGGESCVNAIRSAAFYLLERDKKDEISIISNGESFNCRLDENGVFIKGLLKNSKVLSKISDLKFIVKFNDIYHLISLENSGLSGEEFKSFAFKSLEKESLTKNLACGYMEFDGLSLKPVVYVRAVDTLFYESACGSGSVATLLALNFKDKNLIKKSIKQPSGKFLKVQILNGDEFKISGEVREYEVKECERKI